MIFIILVALVIYFVLIAWTWQSLGFIEKNKKVIFVLAGIVVMYLITLITFQMAKSGIAYPNIEIEKNTRNVLVAIFTGMNGIIVMPQLGRILDKINENEIERKKVKRRIIIIAVVFVICLAFEVGYMKDTQEGILKMYDAMK